MEAPAVKTVGRITPKCTGLLMAAFAILALAAYRATMGISFGDDAHYAAITVRLAQGARPFADEMTTQVLGFLGAVPFAKTWIALFGMTGIVVALRLFYVIVAAAVSFSLYRLLRPSFGDVPTALGAAAPLLAQPYNIFGLSYNTAAMLGLVLASALCVAALRDDSKRTAVASGAVAAFAALSYPPLAIGTLALAAVFAALARGRRLTLPALGGAAAVLTIFAVWLLVTVRVAEIKNALDYSQAVWSGYRSPALKVEMLLRFARRALVTRWTLTAWLLGAVAAIPWKRHAVNAAAAGLMPIACLVPAAYFLATGGERGQFGIIGAAYLVLLTATALLPVTATAVRARDVDTLRGVALTAPLAVLGYLLVAYFSSAGWLSAVTFIAVAPLTVFVLAGLVRLISANRTGAVQAASALLIVGVLLTMLFASSYRDGAPLTLSHRFSSGALAGIATTPGRAADIAQIQEVGARWSGPQDRVLVAGRPLGDLLVPGRMHTNAVWLAMGPSDHYSVEYFDRNGKPDVVYLNRSVITKAGTLEAAALHDPLVDMLVRDYDLVETFDPFAVFVRR